MLQILNSNQKSLTSLAMFFGFGFFLIGLILSFISYPQLSLLIIFIYLVVGLLCFFLGGVRKKLEYAAFLLSFSICLFWFGISSIYLVYLNDTFQNYSDPYFFYQLASKDSNGYKLNDIRLFSEGALAVVLWRSLYQIFGFLGFEAREYIGILFNILIVSFVSLPALRIVVLIFGNDTKRLSIFLLLFNSCAILWLFATILLRDSIVLLLNTYLMLRVVQFLIMPSKKRGFYLGLYFILATIIYPFLRTEFVLVPLIMFFSIVIAKSMISGNLFSFLKFFVPLAVLSIILLIYFSNQIPIFEFLINGKEGYEKVIYDTTNSSSSLGVSLVVNQPLILRIIIGTIYLHLFPIPFWSGFQLDTVYNLFKSLQAIYFWFTLPLFVLGIVNVFKLEKHQSAALLFLIILYLGFSIAIAVTSLEMRHLGVFVISFMIVSLIPNLNSIEHKKAYRNYFFVFLSGVFVIHISWALIKFGV